MGLDVDHINPHRRTVTVTMDWEAAEFIASELPQGDGFTKDWWRVVEQIEETA